MPDPLHALPYELWSLCIEFTIAGRLSGPLDFLMVSTHWERNLLNSPSLWTQIYIQNGEDEMARISTFLHLSKQYPLHVDVMTVLPTVDCLRLVAEHISRVRTILIRPGALNNGTALHAKEWKLAASYVLATLSNEMQLCDEESPFCLGVSLWDGGQSHCHVILLQFTVAARAASHDELNHTWEERIAKTIPAAENQASWAETTSISSIVDLACYAQFQDVIRTTIPFLVKLLEGKEYRIRLEAMRVIGQLGNNVEFHEAITNMIPSLIKLLEDRTEYIRQKAGELIGKLANRVEFREAITTTIPSLITLLEGEYAYVRRDAVELIGKLASHVEFRVAIPTTIPPLIKLLEDEHAYVRREVIELIGKWANHVEFREAIITTIPSLIKLLEDRAEYVRLEADELIGTLANRVEFREAITTTIPSLIKLLEGEYAYVRREAMKLIGKLANHVEFPQAVAIMISSLIKLLEGEYEYRYGYGDEDEEAYVRREAIKLIGKLANHVEFREAIPTMIPSFIKLLEDQYAYVRREVIILIGKLANHVEFREALATTIPILVKLLADGHPRVRREAVKVVGDMKSSGMFGHLYLS